MSSLASIVAALALLVVSVANAAEGRIYRMHMVAGFRPSSYAPYPSQSSSSSAVGKKFPASEGSSFRHQNEYDEEEGFTAETAVSASPPSESRRLADVATLLDARAAAAEGTTGTGSSEKRSIGELAARRATAAIVREVRDHPYRRAFHGGEPNGMQNNCYFSPVQCYLLEKKRKK